MPSRSVSRKRKAPEPTPHTEELCDYEKARLRNIQENKARLAELEINAAKPVMAATPKRKAERRPKYEGPIRKSNRIKGDNSNLQELQVFTDDPNPKPQQSGRDQSLEGREVYQEYHLARLGTCVTTYPHMNVKDKVYDKVNGTTCHQCRQKTIEQKTQCYKCKDINIEGQFCGICLQNRYGENLLEVLELEKWECPNCRGICNCSICRTGKGIRPTGVLHPKAHRLGFASVAHYLVQKYQESNLPALLEKRQKKLLEREKNKTAAPEKVEIKKREDPEELEPEDVINEEDTECVVHPKLNVGSYVACYADPRQKKGKFWVAEVRETCNTNTDKHIRVRWFEKSHDRNTERYTFYRETSRVDNIPVKSIFHSNFDMRLWKVTSRALPLSVFNALYEHARSAK